MTSMCARVFEWVDVSFLNSSNDRADTPCGAHVASRCLVANGFQIWKHSRLASFWLRGGFVRNYRTYVQRCASYLASGFLSWSLSGFSLATVCSLLVRLAHSLRRRPDCVVLYRGLDSPSDLTVI